ncbi:MAG: thymidine phosphorylase [Candidatus Pacebacteria bacterium]|nr:thymidine phosphorylase [Candidatus Paceibacterota bacterium]
MLTSEEFLGEGSFFLKVKHLDIRTGHPWVVVMHEADSNKYGVRAGDELVIKWDNRTTEVSVDITNNLIKEGELGVFKDVLDKSNIPENTIIDLKLAQPAPSLEAIRKKLRGHDLTYSEIHTVVSDIVHWRLDDVQLAFFLASAFMEKGFSDEEIFYLTRAVAETGEMLGWEGVVADKHCIGGVPGNRTTPLVVAIVASLGIKIPKTSSRAVTSEGGTADVMEAIMPVELTVEKIREVVNKTNGCIVWGGALKLAPADDRMLRVSQELSMEPYSKMVVSIMAKKVAVGATHLLIDIPIGPGLKIDDYRDALKVKKLFEFLAKKFKIKIRVNIETLKGPIGRGIGPLLEVRDIMRVLQQKDNRPLDLENRALKLSGLLVELVGKAKKGEGQKIAKHQLVSGQAEQKFKEIIAAQGGVPLEDSEDVVLGTEIYELKSDKIGQVVAIDARQLIKLARLLGSPLTKSAGLYLNKTIGEQVNQGETLATLYTVSSQRLGLALNELTKSELYKIA